ncbi:hypothetical protein COCCADRAFT_93994, partial [Bipolaris zeicola 26-R-13]
DHACTPRIAEKSTRIRQRKLVSCQVLAAPWNLNLTNGTWGEQGCPWRSASSHMSIYLWDAVLAPHEQNPFLCNCSERLPGLFCLIDLLLLRSIPSSSRVFHVTTSRQSADLTTSANRYWL